MPERTLDDSIWKCLADAVVEHAPVLTKSFIIGIMTLITAIAWTGSIGKGVVVAGAFAFLSVFSTWRRPLQALSFWGLVLTLIVWCKPDIANDIGAAIRWIVGLVRSN